MASDSMSTRPSRRLPRTSPAALGLRAIDSTAALTARPCASAARPAANASAKPAVMIDHCATVAPAVAAASCAYTGDTRPSPTRARVAVRMDRVLTTKASCKKESRSEEHTSELQSQSNLVCRLLLEKKKKK